jgi:hypothetical protein
MFRILGDGLILLQGTYCVSGVEACCLAVVGVSVTSSVLIARMQGTPLPNKKFPPLHKHSEQPRTEPQVNQQTNKTISNIRYAETECTQICTFK